MGCQTRQLSFIIKVARKLTRGCENEKVTLGKYSGSNCKLRGVV